MRIHGPGAINGDLAVPGDKSISHRVAMLSSVAQGASAIRGFASNADCHATLDCVERLGLRVERGPEQITIHGNGLTGYRPPGLPARLDAGNSGSTIRMLSGLLAGQPFTSEIDGDASLRGRPMRRVIEPLTRMGAQVTARDGNFAPLTIRGGPLRAIHYESQVASAQVKTCVLFAGLLAEGTTIFREPYPSRDHTERMLTEFGARFTAGEVLSITGGGALRPVEYAVPGDLSSAAFLAAAATLLPGSAITLRGVNLNPTRAAFLDVLERLGANIARDNLALRHGEPVGDLRVSAAALRSEPGGTVLRGEIIPNLIDEVPILAVVGTQVEGRLEVRDAGELRIKESDRLRTVAAGIRALGGEIEEFEDGFAINGPQRLTGGVVQTKGDHRIAMAFSVAGLLAHGATDILDADCAAVSFPEFYDLLAQAAGEGVLVEAK